MTTLKNVKRSQRSWLGRPSWQLVDLNGHDVAAFTHFCERNFDHSFATQKRYAEVTAHFIDYLIEAEAFDRPVTKRYMNQVLDLYPRLLAVGSSVFVKQLDAHQSDNSEFLWMAKVARALKIEPIAKRSFTNALAAINRFLVLSESLQIEAFERADVLGIEHRNDSRVLIGSLVSRSDLSWSVRTELAQYSVLGLINRMRPKGLTKPLNLKSGDEFANLSSRTRAFPLKSIEAVLACATSIRDRLLWMLLAATGIRVSEALNLRWEHVNLEKQTIAVISPSGGGLPSGTTKPGSVRFKGRETESTYVLPHLRTALFDLITDYVKREYIPSASVGWNSGYVLQYIEHRRRGQPYVQVSSAALNKAFKAAQFESGIRRHGRKGTWPIHSLRHCYGDYLLNDLPVDPSRGIFGLEISEVQLLMGHKNAQSTQQYARKRHERLIEKLAAADKQILGLDSQTLPGSSLSHK